MTEYETIPELSVSALSQALKKTLETTFNRICVRGEISGSKRHTSGHFYFALKDEAAVLDGVCWRKTFSALTFVPQDGMTVVCQGWVTTYPGRSKYQFIVEKFSLAGQGSILQLLEERKQKLYSEGLFDAARKKSLPFLPEYIGLITSPTGAVLHDILHRLEDRFPRPIILWPVLVQGESAASEIVAAIDGVNKFSGTTLPPIDVIILARGGGSLEDLWAFNEESVVRAVARSKIPVISAIGHETDTTLTDFAADFRAPTPTAAAEMAVPVRSDLQNLISTINHRLQAYMTRLAREENMRLKLQKIPSLESLCNPFEQRYDDVTEKFINFFQKIFFQKENHYLQTQAAFKSPEAVIEKNQLSFQVAYNNLHNRWEMLLKILNLKLEQNAQLLETCSYTTILKRGFCVLTQDNIVMTSACDVPSEQNLTLHFWDGEILVHRK